MLSESVPKLVLYHEDFAGRSGALPHSLLELLELSDTATSERQSRLESLGRSCDEFLPRCEMCRNFKVAYSTSQHPQRSAPKVLEPGDMLEIYDLDPKRLKT